MAPIACKPMRTNRERLETATLASYAVRSRDSRGRHYADPPHPARLCFERDRDRILHSRCFRRLEYKAQVFVNGTADHYRTRMTHTMEMAAVSRTLARLFRVNEDLTEAIALAHDVGHTPFGHCGEYVLDELMKPFGGFDHNEQSLRWVDLLELQYPDFPGLNLSWEVRAGLKKHEAATPGATLEGFPIGPHQSLEAQIADLADDMTYYAHDADDALEAGVITTTQLADCSLWRAAQAKTRQQYLALTDEHARRITLRNLLDVLVQDVIEYTLDKLQQLAPGSVDDIMQASCRVVDFSPETRARVCEFREFLYREFYFTAAVQDDNQAGVRMMRQLFFHFINHPETMGRKARNRIPTEGLERTVCDYLSGFTDRYALEQHQTFHLPAVTGSS